MTCLYPQTALATMSPVFACVVASLQIGHTRPSPWSFHCGRSEVRLLDNALCSAGFYASVSLVAAIIVNATKVPA